MRHDRRRFLLGCSALAAAGCAPRALEKLSESRPPFTLGVASGYPAPDGVVMWTRLAPEPLAADGGLPPAPVAVRWEVAEDERFARVVRRGDAVADPAWAHSVHVEVTGLQPSRSYWYRFVALGHASPAGRTRTAPRPDDGNARLRFAFASCQNWEHGYYAAYRHMAAEDLDLVVHLGDYIYEYTNPARAVRSLRAGEPVGLDDYRAFYALYRTDTDLQAAHAAFPWLVIWDDHEVDNDYANDQNQDLDPADAFLARRAAAYQAYYEHMPLPAWARPRGPAMQLYASARFGTLAEFRLLDGRQYRDHQACPRPGRGGSRIAADCAERLDPTRTLLGETQERWLLDSLARHETRWNVIAQQTIMAQVDRKPGPARAFSTDGWDGYPAARRRILETLHAGNVPNPLVIGGDIHIFAVTDLKSDFDDPRSPVVASEFVTTSISSRAYPQSRVDAILPDNPHIRFARTPWRGYTTLELTPRHATARLMALDNVEDPASGIRTLATFVVEDGRPGPRPA
ncbi:MAG: alkaline phosphatase D family protein [Pseudomonadota bacterium]